METADTYERHAQNALNDGLPAQALVYATLAVAAAFREIHGLRPFPIVAMDTGRDPSVTPASVEEPARLHDERPERQGNGKPSKK